MAGLLKKAAITLATALTTAAASAHSFTLWGQPAHHDRPHHGYEHNGPRYDNHPRHPQHPPRYAPQENAKDKCERAIFNRARLDIYHPRTQIGFIEGRSFACRIRLDTGKLTNSYNLSTQSGQNAFEKAKDSAYDREYPRQYRPRHHW